jgi:hypothetical protein
MGQPALPFRSLTTAMHLGSTWDEDFGRLPGELSLRWSSRPFATSTHGRDDEYGTTELRFVQDLHAGRKEPEERVGPQPRGLTSLGRASPF